MSVEISSGVLGMSGAVERSGPPPKISSVLSAGAIFEDCRVIGLSLIGQARGGNCTPSTPHRRPLANTRPIRSIEDKYAGAKRKGHRVVPLIHEVFGGIESRAVKLLHEAALRMRGRDSSGEDPAATDAPWSAPSLPPYALQTISIALQAAL